MCGIVGVAGQAITQTGKKIFEDLMVVSNLRGRWGAGVCATTPTSIKSFKTEWSGIDILDMKGYKELVYGGKEVSTLLGHTRWPTKGGNTIDDSHPHIFDKVTGVHNGTLTKVGGYHVSDKQSDSKLFYQNVNDLGFDEAFSLVEGAYCFVFIDHESETLNFIRNQQRPLWFAKVSWGSYGRTLLWASEKIFLEMVLTRAGEHKNAEYVELPINELWSIPVGFTKEEDFTIRKNMWSGTSYWKPVKKAQKRKEAEDPEWARSFRGTGVDRNSSTSEVGKQTYVFDKKINEFVRKDTVGTESPQKVCLPGPSADNELEGKETLRLPAPKNSEGGTSKQQRPKTTTKVSLGSNGAAFLKNLVRKEEVEFYDEIDPPFKEDTVVDLFPPKAKAETKTVEQIEKEFEKLLAQKVEDVPGDLWEDLQLEDMQYDDGAEKLIETFKGKFVTEKRYAELLAFGCAWLGQAATPEDEIYWLDGDNYIFAQVIDDPEAIYDLSAVYPNHPQMREWVARHASRKSKRSAKDTAPHHIPTLH